MGAAGTDVAMETADVVLMSDNLQNIVFALALSRHARRVIFQNLAFALAVIIVLVVSALGFSLMLPIGVIAHEGSTVLVCLNGLRLLTFVRRRCRNVICLLIEEPETTAKRTIPALSRTPKTARGIGRADGLRSASSTRCCPVGVWFSVSAMISRMGIQERVALG